MGSSLNYVFATDLGSGVYDLDGRTLQIYRFTYEKELREVDEDTLGVRFVLPLTFGFFDFTPFDVLSEGIPTRVDSFSLVPGFEFDYLLRDDWHLIPYAARRRQRGVEQRRRLAVWPGRARRAQRRTGTAGTVSCAPSSTIRASATARTCRPISSLRLRQGVDLTRGIGWKIRGREVEFGLYAIFDVILDPPTVPVADGRRQPFRPSSASRSHAAAIQALALGCAATGLRLPAGGRAVGVALPHRHAVLNARRRQAAFG